MKNTISQLNELKSLNLSEGSPLAEVVDRVKIYTEAVQSGQMSTDEFRELLGDLQALKESSDSEEEQRNIQLVHDITQGLIAVLSKI